MELLEQIKISMRITHAKLDEVLNTDIKAAALDLQRAGVQPYLVSKRGCSKKIRDDALIHKAVELFTKGMEDFEGKGEQYMKAYEKLRDAMALCGDWNG